MFSISHCLITWFNWNTFFRYRPTPSPCLKLMIMITLPWGVPSAMTMTISFTVFGVDPGALPGSGHRTSLRLLLLLLLWWRGRTLLNEPIRRYLVRGPGGSGDQNCSGAVTLVCARDNRCRCSLHCQIYYFFSNSTAPNRLIWLTIRKN